MTPGPKAIPDSCLHLGRPKGPLSSFEPRPETHSQLERFKVVTAGKCTDKAQPASRHTGVCAAAGLTLPGCHQAVTCTTDTCVACIGASAVQYAPGHITSLLSMPCASAPPMRSCAAHTGKHWHNSMQNHSQVPDQCRVTVWAVPGMIHVYTQWLVQCTSSMGST